MEPQIPITIWILTAFIYGFLFISSVSMGIFLLTEYIYKVLKNRDKIAIIFWSLLFSLVIVCLLNPI